MDPQPRDQDLSSPQKNETVDAKGTPSTHVLANYEGDVKKMDICTPAGDSMKLGPGGSVTKYSIGTLHYHANPGPNLAPGREKGATLEDQIDNDHTPEPVGAMDYSLSSTDIGPTVLKTLNQEGQRFIVPTLEDNEFTLIPLEDVDIPTSSSRPTLASYSELYVRGLLSADYGLPCWRPEPFDPENQPRGVIPGDVGTYSLGSPFKKIFNLWEEEKHIQELAATRSKDAYRPLGGVVGADRGILEAGDILAPTATCKSPHPSSSEGERMITLHEILCPPKSAGAVLAVLSPADLEATDNNQAMQDYILRHFEEIFRLADGIQPIGDGESLYIITGCIKADVWAMAAFDKVKDKDSWKVERVLELQKSRAVTARGGPAASYKWTRQPAHSRPRLGDSGAEGLKSQTLFLQGYKLAFSDASRSRMRDFTLSAPVSTGNDMPGSSDNHCAPDAQGTPSSSVLPGSCLGPPIPYAFSQLSKEGDIDAQIELLKFPQLSEKPYHPSDLINRMMLELPGAKVALSHDDDWRTFFRESAQAAGKTADLLLENGGPTCGRRPSRTVSVNPDGVAYTVTIMPHDPHKPDEDYSNNTCHDDEAGDNNGADHGNEPHYENDSSWAPFFKRAPYPIIPSSQVRLVGPDGHGDFLSTFHIPFAYGGYGDVYKGFMDGGDGQRTLVAIKVLRSSSRQDIENRFRSARRYRRECEVWGALHHPNILHFRGLVLLDDLPGPGMVSDYKEHGNLYAFMRNNYPFDRLHMAIGIACGLEYLHHNEVVHGNLTMMNILVERSSRTGHFSPVINDFGNSRELTTIGYTTYMGVSEVTWPPELLLHDPGSSSTNKVLTAASDVYSFSLILLQLVTGLEPYSQEKMARFRITYEILKPIHPLRPVPNKYPVLKSFYEFCWPIMQDCWRAEPEERISIQEAHHRLLQADIGGSRDEDQFSIN